MRYCWLIVWSNSNTWIPSYESQPITIETRRWDPVTASASAAIGTGADVMHAATGIVTKPYEEYMKAKGVNSISPAPNASANTSSNSLQPPHSIERKTSSDSLVSQSSNSMSNTRSRQSGPQTAGKMAAASAKSLGNVFGHQTKGLFVDVPLAVTEGLNAIPGLYGSKVREPGKITDWKTGTAAAGKSFVFGIAEGMVDIFVEPYNGGRKEGAKGVVKGLGKGSLGFITRTGAGKFPYDLYQTIKLMQSFSGLGLIRLHWSRGVQKRTRGISCEDERSDHPAETRRRRIQA